MSILSNYIGTFCKENKLLIATAESCTAGLIASEIAETSGSSSWLDAGFVVYSPEAKNTSLDVSLETIDIHNITSCEVAEEMAIGAIRKSRANVGVSTTGVAGPSGGTEEIPVGTVCFGWAFKQKNKIIHFSEKKVFDGTRNEIREAATMYALNQLPTLYKKLMDLNNTNNDNVNIIKNKL